MNQFSVTILGSSSAIPTSTRFPSSQIVSHKYKPFLVDCGEGTQIQLRKSQIRFSRIDHIFISHLHGDHFFGLIGLISSFNLLGRKTELHLFAPKEIRQIIELQLEISQSKLNFEIRYYVLTFDSLSLLYENEQLEIYSFPLKHSILTCGFLFKEKPYPLKIRKEALLKYDIPDDAFNAIKCGSDFVNAQGEIIKNSILTSPGQVAKSYAYCSDTAFSFDTIQYIAGVDLLYHETSFMENRRGIAEAKMHSTTVDAAKTANLAAAKKLIIGHFSARYKELDELLAETQKDFENTLLASEGLVVNV
ncbi:MAG TPA: ribonuclease Z [Bacteroidales bacterium]|nr:ribonuclease Z [Bacteroidales bacterium]